jgi:hypothetical protein
MLETCRRPAWHDWCHRQSYHRRRARLSARAHESRVAPVVNTSSSSRTRNLSTRSPLPVAYAPRTESQCSVRVSTNRAGRGLVRSNQRAPCFQCGRRARGRAVSAATGTAAGAAARHVTKSWASKSGAAQATPGEQGRIDRISTHSCGTPGTTVNRGGRAGLQVPPSRPLTKGN